MKYMCALEDGVSWTAWVLKSMRYFLKLTNYLILYTQVTTIGEGLGDQTESQGAFGQLGFLGGDWQLRL